MERSQSKSKANTPWWKVIVGVLNVGSYLQTWERCADMCHLGKESQSPNGYFLLVFKQGVLIISRGDIFSIVVGVNLKYQSVFEKRVISLQKCTFASTYIYKSFNLSICLSLFCSFTPNFCPLLHYFTAFWTWETFSSLLLNIPNTLQTKQSYTQHKV